MYPYLESISIRRKYTHLYERGKEEVRKRYGRVGFQEPQHRISQFQYQNFYFSIPISAFESRKKRLYRAMDGQHTPSMMYKLGVCVYVC